MCLVVVDQDDVDEVGYTTRYRSAIVLGRAFLVEDETGLRESFAAFLEKYSPSRPEEEREARWQSWRRTGVWRIDPDRITGKASPSLIRR